MTTTENSEHDLVSLAADIVSAYVAKNSVRPADLSDLIASTHAALQKLSAPAAPAQAEKPIPPVPIRKTVTPDYLISLEDGRQYKSLKRHLTSRGMTVDEYKRKWGLPADYPMVCESYAKTRSDLAKNNGLGQSRRKAA